MFDVEIGDGGCREVCSLRGYESGKGSVIREEKKYTQSAVEAEP
jgi:hypothetical protein